MLILSFFFAVVELEPKYSVLTSYEPDVHYSDLQFRVHHAHQIHGIRHRRQAPESTTNMSTSNQGDTTPLSDIHTATVTPSSGNKASSSSSRATTTTTFKPLTTTVDPFKNATLEEVSPQCFSFLRILSGAGDVFSFICAIVNTIKFERLDLASRSRMQLAFIIHRSLLDVMLIRSNHKTSAYTSPLDCASLVYHMTTTCYCLKAAIAFTCMKRNSFTYTILLENN